MCFRILANTGILMFVFLCVNMSVQVQVDKKENSIQWVIQFIHQTDSKQFLSIRLIKGVFSLLYLDFFNLWFCFQSIDTSLASICHECTANVLKVNFCWRWTVMRNTFPLLAVHQSKWVRRTHTNTEFYWIILKSTVVQVCHFVWLCSYRQQTASHSWTVHQTTSLKQTSA